MCAIDARKDLLDPLQDLKGKVLHALQDGEITDLKKLSRVFVVTAWCDCQACYELCRDGMEQKSPGQAELIARATVELLFNYVFLADDPSRFDWYIKAGFWDLKCTHEEYEKVYGDNPSFTAYLARMSTSLDNIRQQYGIETSEKKTNYWPSPARLIRVRENKKVVENPHGLKENTHDLLSYLELWMYGEYSQNAHCRYSGVLHRACEATISLRGIQDPPKQDDLESYRSKAVYRPALLNLMLLSEIIADQELDDLKPAARSIWDTLAKPELFLEALEILDLRYRDLLS